jgi:penicillin-binding protein 1A
MKDKELTPSDEKEVRSNPAHKKKKKKHRKPQKSS